ncbi:metallophosphoesterase [Prosthecobacter sp.]|uniref:metallophosphoesterase n=1 Tax=Prosthecobacter sp. TaxID=1965333 RepID=UPI003783FD24
MTTTTRRRFLRQTFAFSALSSATWPGHSSAAAAAVPAPGAIAEAQHLLAIGDWGADRSLDRQRAVAQAMQSYTRDKALRTSALLMLGDNFYGPFEGGVSCPRWRTQFEEMYPRSAFDCPCYAMLGNHDYHEEPASKPDDQLAYAAKGGTRWTLPAKWYRFDLPSATFLVLDSNYRKPQKGKGGLKEEEKAAQLAWLKAELARPRTTPFLIVLAHHPLYSNGVHGDSSTLIEAWEPLFRQHGVHLYLCGHDHDLQHLELDSHPTSFVVSGAGGTGLTDIQKDPKKRGRFSQKVQGFTHLELSPQRLTLRHVDTDGQVLHAFSKTPEGKVVIL